MDGALMDGTFMLGICHLMGGHLSLNGWGNMVLVGHLWPKWVGSYDKVSCCFVWKYAQKIAGLQGSTLSDHRLTTGFGLLTPYLWTTTERAGPLPTLGLFYLRSPALGWLSKYCEYTVAKQNYEYTVAKQNGDGAEWVELFITLTKGWANQPCLSSCPGIRGLFSASCIEGSSLDTRWILGACSAATLSRKVYYFVWELHSAGFKWDLLLLVTGYLT